MHSGNLPGNPHAIQAHNTAEWTAAERTIDALLALAFEQRTANLIALANAEAVDDIHVIWDEIRERMEVNLS